MGSRRSTNADLATTEPRSGTRPKYRVLRDALVALIDDLPRGASMPTERELCEQFSVSRATVRQALERLEIEQRVVRVQGKGTFVSPEKIDQILELSSHTDDMASRGLAPRSQLLGVSATRADPAVAAALGLAPGAPVVEIERLRLADDEPLAIEQLTVDAGRFPGLGELLEDGASFYELLGERYRVELAQAEESIEAAPAGEREADLLHLRVGAPVLVLARISRDGDDHPIEYVRAIYRADRFRFRTRLHPAGRRRRRGLPAGSRVRAATAADAPGLAQVFIGSWRANYIDIVEQPVLDRLDETDIADWLSTLIASPGSATWVAESPSGEILGFSRIGEDPADSRRGHVYSLYVAPAAQGQGVGRALLEHDLAVMTAQGPRPVTLWVFERNVAARRLYVTLGFVPDGARRVEPEYGAQEIRMQRPAGSERAER